MSDWEYSDKSCPKCSADLASKRCDELWCEGGTLEYDDDDWPDEKCDRCNGQGTLEWCRECGWDMNYSQFLSPQDEANWRATAKAKEGAGK